MKKEIPTLTEKDYVGSGAYKNCYRLNKKEVALVPFYGSITTDYNRLVRLKKLKVPVPAFRLEKVRVNNKVRSALVMPYLRHSRAEWNAGLGYRLTRARLRGVEKIYFAIKKAGVEIHDLQFVWDKKDNLFVTDPNGIYKCKTDDNQSLWDLADFIRKQSKRLKFKTKIPKKILEEAEIRADYRPF